jgi:hypothetical protein
MLKSIIFFLYKPVQVHFWDLVVLNILIPIDKIGLNDTNLF